MTNLTSNIHQADNIQTMLQRLKKCIWCFLRAGLSLIVLEGLSLIVLEGLSLIVLEVLSLFFLSIYVIKDVRGRR
jgi:hypothetical protein